jgi:hypothetical protein
MRFFSSKICGIYSSSNKLITSLARSSSNITFYQLTLKNLAKEQAWENLYNGIFIDMLTEFYLSKALKQTILCVLILKKKLIKGEIKIKFTCVLN